MQGRILNASLAELSLALLSGSLDNYHRHLEFISVEII